MSQLDPPLYPSEGLLQAHFDAIGGGYLETTVGGDTPAYFAVVMGQQISIPASVGGGQITFIRGIWNQAVKMRWAGFESDLDPSLALPAAANLFANANSDINTWTFGTGAKFDITAVGGVITSALGSGAMVGSSWDISTGTYANLAKAVAASPRGIAFSTDGKTLYVLSGANQTVYQYPLTTAWDISTLGAASATLSVAAQDTNPWGITLSADGTKLYVTGQTNSSIYEYTLATAWSLTGAAYANKSLAVGTQDGKPHGITFDSTGTIMHVAGYSSDHIYQYSLSTAWDIGSAAYTNKSLYTAGTSDTPGWLSWKPDGTRLFFTGAFSHVGMIYEWQFSTAWDLSTGTDTGKSLNAAAQDTAPSGIVIPSDGLEFFLAGQTNSEIFKFNIGTSSGAYATGQGYAVGQYIPFNGGNNNAYAPIASVDAQGAITGLGAIVGGTGYVTANGIDTQPAVNLPTLTRVTLPQAVADGTGVQVFFMYRNGSRTLAGQAIGGYPGLHLAEIARDFGTANDGDNYSSAALYHAYKTFSLAACKDMADSILDAQVSAGLKDQFYAFDLPLIAEQDSGGLYYSYDYTSWDWSVKALPDGSGEFGLNVQTSIPSGGPPYPYAVWGSWIAYPISAVSPFNGFNFDFVGDGSGNRVALSVNIHNPSDSAGEYGYGYACLTTDLNIRRSFTLTAADFWQLTNIVLSADRSNSYATISGDGTIAPTIGNVQKDNNGASGYHRFLAKRMAFWMASGAGTYAECYLGSNDAAFASAGSDRLKADLDSSFAGTVTVTIKDANSALYTYALAVVAGSQLAEIPYTSFTPGSGIVHPIKEVRFKVAAAIDGTLDIDLVRCSTATADIITLSNAGAYTVLNGWKFSFDAGSYSVYWKNIQLVRPAVNPYPGISRWGYSWSKYAGGYGSGTYRGPQAAGYQWMLGYTLSGKTYPAGTIAMAANGVTTDLSGTPIIARIRQFLKDAQDAYIAQYPAQMAGPFMKKYGVDSWEQIGASGYIAGVLVPNATYPQGILDQFYCEGSDDWYGYQYRDFVSIAMDYFASGDATSKTMLDRIVAWMAAKCTYDAVLHTVTVPTTFNVDGTLANSSNIYAEACLAAMCIYKYWTDGDATCLTWYSRFLEDLHYNQKKTSIGTLAGMHPNAFGTGYSWAQVNFTVNTGATAPTVKAIVAGGGIVRYEVTYAGANITSISYTIAGDGSGAKGNPYLADALVGAYNNEHTDWEAAEILNTLSLLVTGRNWGSVNFQIASPPAWVEQDYKDLVAFFDRNTGDKRPSMLTSSLVPMHEFTFSSWHGGAGIEDPRYRDTHTDGDCWTEDIGPMMFAAVDRYLYDGNRRWLRNILALIQSMGGSSITQLVMPVDQARLAEQAKFTRRRALIFKPQQIWCQNTFGVNNGTTSFCTATGEPCYQTYASCKDTAHFKQGIRQPVFCNDGMDVPLGEEMRPYIDLASFQPSTTEIPIIGGLARRSNIKLVFRDEVCADTGEDPYISQRATPAKGTYWTRFLARNPYLVGQQAILSHGYRAVPFTWDVFQDELYQIASVSGPDANNMITIELTDVVKVLDNNMVPPPTSGALAVDLLATEYNGSVVSSSASTIVLAQNASPVDGYYDGMEVYISVGSGSGQRRLVSSYVGASRTATLATPWKVLPDTGSQAEVAALSLNLDAGEGAQYNDPAVTGREERVRIGDEEIRYATLSGDVLSWPDNSYRAKGNTTRADHKAGDGAQQCLVVVNEKFSDVIQRIYNQGALDNQYIDLIQLQNIDDTWLGEFMRLTRSVNVPTKASDLANQLLLPAGVYSWWDGVQKMQTFSTDLPQLDGTVTAITADNVVKDSMVKETLDSMRLTDFALIYSPVSSIANQAQLKNYLNNEIAEDANAISTLEYGALGRIMKQLFTPWLTDANNIYAAVYVARVLRRLRDVPLKLSFQLDPRDEVHLGQVIDVTHRKVTDMTGAPKTVRMRVTKTARNGNQQVSAVSTSLSSRDGIIAPPGTADYPADSTYGHASDANSLMPDGTAPYTIV